MAGIQHEPRADVKMKSLLLWTHLELIGNAGESRVLPHKLLVKPPSEREETWLVRCSSVSRDKEPIMRGRGGTNTPGQSEPERQRRGIGVL